MERNEILGRLRERIVRFAASRLRGGDSAEDIAQETLLVIEEKYALLERIEDLVPLSLQIARFKLVAMRRKMLRRGEHTAVAAEDAGLRAGDPDPETAASRHEQLTLLEAGLKSLGDRCRELFRLKLEGNGFAEIQKRMKAATINTVYTWDLRCRKQLLERLKGLES